jgi:hypothetical protein
MKHLVFYLLLYFYPLAKVIFATVRRIFALLSIIKLIATLYYGFLIKHILAAAIFFAGSICGLILEEKYTTLLLKLQPDNTEYTFYS